MIKVIYLVLISLISSCNGNNGGTSSSSKLSSPSVASDCPPSISVGGENYDVELCKLNQQLPSYCSYQTESCNKECQNEYRRRIADGVQGATLISFLNSCKQSCRNNIYTPCLLENSYPSEVCDQPKIIPNPDCNLESNNQNINPSEVLDNVGTENTELQDTHNNDADFTNCDLTTKYQTADIGSFGLCQSSVTETLFKVKFTMTTTTRNCIIPIYKDSTGSSTYIGQPQCTSVTEPNLEIQGQLNKNRSGFESYPINGVMVMKESLLDNYFSCMHAFINWLPQACPSGVYTSSYCSSWISLCPYGANTNYTCDQAARSYMNEVCTNFKSQYESDFIDIRLK